MSDRRLFARRPAEEQPDPLVQIASDFQTMLADAKPESLRRAEAKLAAARNRRAAVVAEQRKLAAVAHENGREMPRSEIVRLADDLAVAERDIRTAHAKMTAERDAFAADLVGRCEPFRKAAAVRLVEALQVAGMAMNVLMTGDRYVTMQGMAAYGKTPFPAATPFIDVVGALSAARRIAGD